MEKNRRLFFHAFARYTDQVTRMTDFLHRHQTMFCFLLVLLTSYFTYFFNYQNPQAFYWDENYHVASAQKYMNGVHFMEPHPPLGKLLIALGEVIVNANPQDDQFIKTDYAQNPPAEFSFTGYRLFPAMLAWLSAPLFFAIFLLITRKPVWSLLLSSLYIFDNAQIVHGRGTMLETALMFFSLVAIVGVLLLRHRTDRQTVIWAAILLGAGFACALATKVFALILVLLFPAAIFFLWRVRSRIPLFFGVTVLAFVIPYVAVWHTHFALGKTIVPDLPDAGYYQASPEYKNILTQGTSGNLMNFPVMLHDSIKFVGHYQTGVPRLDLCKSDENGSPWFLWPVGGRTINYRWATGGGQAYRYLSLVPNPVIWISVLFAVIFAGSLVVSEFFHGEKRLKERTLLLTFLALYCGFMAAVSQIDRVMYLYHYFLPLAFGSILLSLIVLEIDHLGSFRLTDGRKTWGLLFFTVIILLGFEVYRPLSYYEPITDKQVEARNIIKVWELRCARCALESPLVVRPVN